MIVKIQNIIVRDSVHPNGRRLYFTLDKHLHSSVLSFGTYFNSFWLQDWKEYTSIKRFYLNIRFKGQCIISLVQSRLVIFRTEAVNGGFETNEKVSQNTFYQKQYTSDGTDYIQIEIPETNPDCRMIHCEIEYANNKTFDYQDAFYSAETTQPPARTKIAIVICTFKRDKFVYENIDALKTFFREHSELGEACDVFVVDNGQTITPDIESDNIFLFPNSNAGGGSGGFTRGIIEAIRSEKKYTHVLLMDDDIEIDSEALQRTYALASLVNTKYSHSFISGSMFRTDIRDFQWESRARIKGLFLLINAQFTLSDFRSLIVNEILSTKHTPHDYAAWWYCCIPLKSIGLDKLPFPFFVRGDDIDYALKYADKILHINGICVWHQPFGNRRSNVIDIYITIRNFVILNILHNTPWPLTVFNLMCLFAVNVFAYNYKGAYLLYRVVQDVISKHNIYEENQIELINRYKAYNEAQNDYTVNLSKAYQTKVLNPFMKMLILLTYGGHILPGILFRRETTAIAGYRLACSAKCFARKKVYIYDPNSGKSTIRTINRTQAFKLGFQFLFALLKFVFFYPSIRKRLQGKEKYYRTIEFWQKHLGLKKE